MGFNSAFKGLMKRYICR